MSLLRSALLAALAGLWIAGSAPAAEIAGVHVPDAVTVQGHTLGLQGAGVRKKFFFKVYVGALYLANPSPDAARAVGADEPKRISMFFVRSVGEDKLRKAFEEGFFKAAQERLDALRERIDRFLGFFAGGVQKGQAVHLTYLPGAGTEVAVGGEVRGTIPGRDFMEALWGIWLGEVPADHGLKKAMLGNR